MKKIVIKNGLIAAAILMGIQLASYLIYGPPNSSNFDTDEIIGYASIVLCLIFVFLGIREYQFFHRETSFIKNLGLGAAISLLPSLGFGLYSVAYYKWIHPDFLEEYGAYQLEKLRLSLSPQEFETARVQFSSDMALWDSVGMQFSIMFLTVFTIGLIISVLSSLYFQLKPIRQ